MKIFLYCNIKMYVYIVFTEEFEKSISVFSNLENAENYLENKKYGKHTLFKCLIDGPSVKLNDFYESISIVDL